MRKAGLMSTIGSTLGTLETVMVEATRTVAIVATYNTNWQEGRELELAEARHARAVRWSKLGAAIRTQELNVSDVQLAMEAYKTKGE